MAYAGKERRSVRAASAEPAAPVPRLAQQRTGGRGVDNFLPVASGTKAKKTTTGALRSGQTLCGGGSALDLPRKMRKAALDVIDYRSRGSKTLENPRGRCGMHGESIQTPTTRRQGTIESHRSDQPGTGVDDSLPIRGRP